jgi:thiol-disulfide isomerase/thioredoxin
MTGSRAVYLALALALALAAGALIVGGNGTKVATDPVAGVLVRDDPMPVVAGVSLAGGTTSSQDFAGKLLVVNAWATWCGPCGKEQPALVRVASDYRDRGVRFMGIMQTDDPAAGRSWLLDHHVPYPSVDDQAGEFAGDLGYIGLPNTFIVDSSGVIRFQIAGPTTEAQLSELLDRVLEPSASPSAT